MRVLEILIKYFKVPPGKGPFFMLWIWYSYIPFSIKRLKNEFHTETS